MESSAANSRWVVGLITLQKAKLGMIGCSRCLCPLSVSNMKQTEGKNMSFEKDAP